jgi:hypothetical protein
MAKLVKLTRPDGKPVWLRASEVTRISQSIDYDANRHTTIDFGGASQTVSEYSEDVVKLVEAADG